MNGTIYMPVGEVCSSISDTYREKKNMVTLINTSDVLEGRVLNHERVPNSNLKGQFKKTFQRDDILYSEIRPQNRRFAYVDFSPIDYIASTKLMVIRAKKDVVSPKYLYYFLKNSSTVAELQLLAETRSGTFPQITFSEVANLTIPVPSLAVQEVIVQTMQCLEDKITCNEQINDNLADLLQTIYQERFVNDILAVNQGVLSDICSYSRDKVAVSELNIRTYFSTENMLSGKAGSTEATSLPTTSQTTACHKGDTLISNIRPYFKKIVYCEDNCGCSTDVLCFTPSQPRYSAYLFSTLYADKFFAFMVAGSKGTKMPRGDKQQIMTYPVVLPSEEELAGFNTIASPLLEQIYSNRAENKRLSILRDTLLPKLMSGEIDVSAVQL
jgi:type I restriction enzyme S subunit